MHAVDGVPLITDDGLEKMVQMCSRRLLAHVARMVRGTMLQSAVGGGFNGLYSEIKTHILAHLPAKSLGLIASTSRKLNSLGERPFTSPKFISFCAHAYRQSLAEFFR